MPGKKNKGCLAASFAAATLGIGLVWTVANEIYFKPLGEKIAERWGCSADVDGCLRTANAFVAQNAWLCIVIAFALGTAAGLLLSSRLRLRGIRFGRQYAAWRKFGHRERALIKAAESAPGRRLIVRRNDAPPTIAAGSRIFGGASDPSGASAWVAALDRLVRLGRVKDPLGRGEVYDLIS